MIESHNLEKPIWFEVGHLRIQLNLHSVQDQATHVPNVLQRSVVLITNPHTFHKHLPENHHEIESPVATWVVVLLGQLTISVPELGDPQIHLAANLETPIQQE